MSTFTINGHDIEPYIHHVSEKQKSEIYNLTLQVVHAVEKQLPIGFLYNNSHRLVLPHSIYLQDKTEGSIVTVSRAPLRTGMRFAHNGARKAIGMDAEQVLSTDDASRTGWKTFHLDQIDNRRLMTHAEMRHIFKLEEDERIYEDVDLID